MFEVEFWSQSLRQLSSDCPSAPNWPFFPGFVNQELDTANSSPLRVGTVTSLFTEDNGGAVPPEGARKLHPLSVPTCHLFMRHGSPAALTHQLQPHSGATPPALCSCFTVALTTASRMSPLPMGTLTDQYGCCTERLFTACGWVSSGGLRVFIGV